MQGGYTPLEALAFRIPTLTTTLAGFGLWVRTHYAGQHPGRKARNNKYGKIIPHCLSDYNNGYDYLPKVMGYTACHTDSGDGKFFRVL